MCNNFNCTHFTSVLRLIVEITQHRPRFSIEMTSGKIIPNNIICSSFIPLLKIHYMWSYTFQHVRGNIRLSCILFRSRIALLALLNISQSFVITVRGSVARAIQITSWENIETRCLRQRAKERPIHVARMCAGCVGNFNEKAGDQRKTSGSCDDTPREWPGVHANYRVALDIYTRVQ